MTDFTHMKDSHYILNKLNQRQRNDRKPFASHLFGVFLKKKKIIYLKTAEQRGRGSNTSFCLKENILSNESLG